MHHAVMRICIFHRLSIICTQNEGFGGFEGEYEKILSSNPQKALPCVNTRMLVYRMSKLVQRFNGLSSRSVKILRTQKEI